MREHKTLWDAWSDEFQAAWNAETDADELPPAPIHYGPGFPEEKRFELLPELEEADVIELGCGGGQASVGFANADASSVTGVDLSPRQLSHARELRDSHGAEVALSAGDVTSLPFADESFDLAFSSWVFQMVPDLEDAFEEAVRVLRPGGVFVFAIPHPFYELYDPESRDLERSYFDSTPEQKPIGDLNPDLTVLHRTIGELHRALTDAGARVERILEPGSDDPEVYEEQWSHKPELMALVPPTLVVRAVVSELPNCRRSV